VEAVIDEVVTMRGGRRPGAGRKPGVPSQKTMNRLKMAEEAATLGITPLEVMLRTMRELWALGSEEGRRRACEIAKDAAPYIHPRLSTIEQNLVAEPRQLTRPMMRRGTGLHANQAGW
jgi:hypothetical protein